MKKGLLTFLGLALVGTVSIGWGEDARMVEAQALYDTYCVSCHGEDLDGNGEVAELLIPIRVTLINISLSRHIAIGLKIRSARRSRLCYATLEKHLERSAD